METTHVRVSEAVKRTWGEIRDQNGHSSIDSAMRESIRDTGHTDILKNKIEEVREEQD